MSPAAPPFVESILHVSDFSESSIDAFGHALAIALLRQARLTLFQAERPEGGGSPWDSLPPVRSTLERWGLLEPGSPRSAVYDQLSVRVKKVASDSRDPLRAALAYLDSDPVDLLVLGSESREGLPAWSKDSMPETLARESITNTLFVPSGRRGFVSFDTGELDLHRILVAVDRRPSPSAALTIATRAASLLTDEVASIHVLHIGDDAGVIPGLGLEDGERWKYTSEMRSGEVVDEILAVAEQQKSDLIVMTTAGRQGVLDALRGSTTEQVVRRAPCPLLAVQAGWVGAH